MNKIVWGIIGAGDVCEVKSGPAFQKAENSALKGIMRRDADKAASFAKRHNVPFWTTNHNDLLNDTEINAIYIATPPAYHEMYALAAFEAGKHVYLEKPMALDHAACKRISEAAEMHNTKLVIAHYRRALPAFKKVKELIDNGTIGKVHFATIRIFQPAKSKIITNSDEHWRLNPKISGGGLFHDIAPHQLDLMMTYFGTPKVVMGTSFNQDNTSPADDAVTGIITYNNNVFVNGIWAFNADDETNATEQCEIHGTEGIIRFSFFGNEVCLRKNGEELVFKFRNPENIQLPMIQETVNYFLGLGSNPCSGKEGAQVIQTMDLLTSSCANEQ